MALDENKAKVYEIIFNMILKAFLCLAAVVAFFIVLFKLLDAKTTFDSWKYGLIETFLTCCIFLPFQHYFPVFGSKPKARKLTKKS